MWGTFRTVAVAVAVVVFVLVVVVVVVGFGFKSDGLGSKSANIWTTSELPGAEDGCAP